MSAEVAVAVLRASAGVTAIVGSGDDCKVSPLIKAQTVVPPAVTVQRVSTTPQNHLRGFASLDDNRVQTDSWATTREGVLALASACRTAMQSAGHLCLGEFDNYDPETDPGLYRITQDFEIWV
jgi:hypothetical protein